MLCYSWLWGWKIPADLHVLCGIASFPGDRGGAWYISPQRDVKSRRNLITQVGKCWAPTSVQATVVHSKNNRHWNLYCVYTWHCFPSTQFLGFGAVLEPCLYPFILSAPSPYPGGIIAVSGTRTVVLEWNFIARIILESIALLRLFSAICIIATGSHHAIIGPRKGCQLKRLYVLHNFGEHLSVSLASFELRLNIILSVVHSKNNRQRN